MQTDEQLTQDMRAKDPYFAQTLPASRETDVLILESVLGKTVRWIGDIPLVFSDVGWWSDPAPYFTTRIENAFQLAEKFKVGVNPWHGGNGNWVALVHLERGHGLPSALADTPALAICRAVLLAHARGLLS